MQKPQRHKLFLISALLLCSWNSQSYAADDQKTLNTVNKKLEQETKEKKSIEQKIKQINEKLSSTKKQMIDVAQNIMQNENKLKSFEERITNLELKELVIQDQLTKDKVSISKLIIALERIERTPPEAMLASPKTPYKMAQSALIMGDILPSINKHAIKLKRNLETLQTVKDELKDQKEELEKTTKNFKLKHTELAKLIDIRQELHEKANDDLKSQEILIEKFSLQAKNLQDLLDKIEEEQKKEANRIAKNLTRKPKNTAKIPNSGEAQMPISGIIRTSYHQKDELGSSSNGLKIEGRPGALVVSPMGGIVQFTGAFKKYGNIIIIEHANGYHSLISGIEKTSVKIGSSVQSGEPIAELPNSSLNPRPTLYYELRKNGKPANPSLIFAELG